MLRALLIGGSLPDLLHTGSPWPGKGGGKRATTMYASSPPLEVRTELCPLSPGFQQVKGVHLLPPCHAEMNCSAPRIMGAPFTAEEKQSTKLGCSLELPSLSTGKPLKEVRKDHRSAWTEEVTSRCLFFLFFSFLFPLSYSMVIRNIVIKQQV